MKLDKQVMMEQSVKYGAKAANLAAHGLKKAGSAMETFARRLSKDTEPKQDPINKNN